MKAATKEINIRLTKPHNLSDDELAAWTQWHQADPLLWSPYFHPGFTQAVASIRNDVEVAVLEDADGLAGFFPFQRSGFGFGRQVGGRLCDFQGVITRPGFVFDADELIRNCRLSAWDFTHLLADQPGFSRYCQHVESSPYLDLSNGYDEYVEERRQAGSTTIKQTLRKVRKIERELGPLRYNLTVTDPDMLATMMEWKSRQYLLTGYSDVFAYAWTVELIKKLHQTCTPEFGGRLSTLYAGDTLIALHFGMFSRDVLHYWFPVYDPAYGKYSPGLILVLEMAREAAGLGRKRLDLGKGQEEFKHSLKSGETNVAMGSVEIGPVLRNVRRCWRNTRVWLKTSPIGAPARATARLMRPLRDWLAFK